MAQNNGFGLALTPSDRGLLRMLRAGIKHVIYIVKENRTYDQMLGDLPRQWRSDLTLFGGDHTERTCSGGAIRHARQFLRFRRSERQWLAVEYERARDRHGRERHCDGICRARPEL